MLSRARETNASINVNVQECACRMEKAVKISEKQKINKKHTKHTEAPKQQISRI